jgi:hypothetical protein
MKTIPEILHFLTCQIGELFIAEVLVVGHQNIQRELLVPTHQYRIRKTYAGEGGTMMTAAATTTTIRMITKL